ncbi:ACT domain-containing protein [Numidum massiliense]|uniref:ACT domain-containing protein n=1 Tax=Numidum massiliense TaxID=1522315 RepID=UPI0006D57966|nr:ACT domain-containing protein [Numidum massiliense]
MTREQKNRAIINVTGIDRIGIIARVTNILAENNVNVLDIRQTILDDFFTMMMLVDLSTASLAIDGVRDQLHLAAEELGVTITVQHEAIFHYMHRID